MAGVEETSAAPLVKRNKLFHCVDWLQKQNELMPKKSRQNQNDIQFIIECNAQRRKFFLSANNEDISVPSGVDEPAVKPLKVPRHKLRVENLRMLCEWQECQCYYTDYELFQKHVADHIPASDSLDENGQYTCMWDICGHTTKAYDELIRHVNYHAYHAKLMAIGFNGRLTLNLERCKKDSSKRNKLPDLKAPHCCLWTGCSDKFNSIQEFFDHMKRHVSHTDENLCSWGGCGMQFHRKVLLTMHLRRHTEERLIACYHCGRHFACNRKLRDHLARQNVNPDAGHMCWMCGQYYGSAALLRQHTRQHVNGAACALCDMSAPTPAALAQHVRYRHVGDRCHACAHCDYKAVRKADLDNHVIKSHSKKGQEDNESDVGPSDEEDSDGELKRKKKIPRKYACHLCGKDSKLFTRGDKLTIHLIKIHGAQWPYGYSRFRYQISEDGLYRLTTTRFEFEEISRMIEDGYSGPKDSLSNTKLKFDVRQISEPTEDTPRRFQIILKNEDEVNEAMSEEPKAGCSKDNEVEITMCDVDEEGNIISSQVINSGVVGRL